MPLMTTGFPQHEIFAIRYARRDARRSDHFVGGDPHDAPMPMDYFTWVIRDEHRVVLVDTGFTADVAKQRKREHLRCPTEGLKLLGIAPESVRDVVQTHLHYDHVGNFEKFPNARFHLTDKEMAFATGRYMKYAKFRHSFEPDDIAGMVRLNFKGRVEFHDSEAELAPGISIHPVGGHTPGLQVVRVSTARGWVVLASDALHYYENWMTNRPFSTAWHLGDMVEAYRTVERLAQSPRHVIPGHDPAVMRQYPPPRPELEGIVVRLDVDPSFLPNFAEEGH
jgi:glyoxylase-like metal-dependent hydrolase (beta-lactamase superfamily II)